MTSEQFAALREGDRISHPMSGREWLVTMVLDRAEGRTVSLVVTSTVGLTTADAKDWVMTGRRRTRNAVA